MAAVSPGCEHGIPIDQPCLGCAYAAVMMAYRYRREGKATT